MSADDVKNYMDSLRQTGRTGRMIEAAKNLLQWHGGALDIYIIAADDVHAKKIEKLLFPIVSIIVVPITQFLPNFDWVSMRPFQSQPNSTFLIDHSVIEQYLKIALQMLHRFDQ